MNKILNTIFILIFSLFLAGCVHQELVPPDQTSNLAQQSQSTVDISDLNTSVQTTAPSLIGRIPFPASEYARLSKKGSATIKGRIYIISPNGQKVVGKSTRLYLNPVTSYSRQWYQQSYLGGKKLAKADPRLYNYLRFTASDSSGNFSFFGVPAGKYYLIGMVRCKDECGYSTTQSIRIAKEISVGDGESITVDLSKSIE